MEFLARNSVSIYQLKFNIWDIIHKEINNIQTQVGYNINLIDLRLDHCKYYSLGNE